MAEPLKYLYNDKFFNHLVTALKKVYPAFQKTTFLKAVYGDNWEDKELKDRMRHIAITLERYLPSDFKVSSKILTDLVEELKTKSEEMSFVYMFIPDFIEVFGIDDFKTSVKAMEKITQFTSCEFAVRPFLLKYPDKMLKQMLLWSKHKNAMVRRLSTEGCRPRLPWAMALPAYKKNPSQILPILERLKGDSSESVRRSVANNLNDISKDNPELALEIAQSWFGKSKETDWVVKHACRGLLKAGHQDALQLFGFGNTDFIKVDALKIHTPKVKVGAALKFSFQVSNLAKESLKIRLEYGVYFQKANGSLSRKVFKISERRYEAGEVCTVERKQAFKVITTRKLYPGLHQVAVIANGKEYEMVDFQLEVVQ